MSYANTAPESDWFKTGLPKLCCCYFALIQFTRRPTHIAVTIILFQLGELPNLSRAK